MTVMVPLIGFGGASLPKDEPVGAFPTLLWKNASPTSAFAEQTISVDLSAYDLTYIFFRYSTATDQRNVLIADKGTSCIDFISYQKNEGLALRVSSRTVAVRDQGVSFSSCTEKETTKTSITTKDNCVIPTAIYGIKVKAV